MVPNFLLLFPVLLPLCQCSGYIEFRLKSIIDLPNSTLHVDYRDGKHEKHVHDIPLVANETCLATGIQVDFTRNYEIWIQSGPVEQYGFYNEKITVMGNSGKKTITGEKVALPFTGLRLDFLCDRNWHGRDCKGYCNNDYAAIIGRRCTEYGDIGCPLGFRGPNCDQPLDQKASECQCQNGGICVSYFENPLDSKDSFICECPIYWYAPECAHNMWRGRLFSEFFDKEGNQIWEDTIRVDNEFYER